MLKRRMISLLMALAMACGACVAVSANEAQELDMSKAVITSSELFITQGIENPDPLEFKGENAFDGDVYTFWQPLTSPNGDWLRMDFEEPVTFNRAKIYEQINYDKNRYNVTRFKIQYSDDGERWKDACEGAQIGRCSDLSFREVTTKHVRLIIKATDTENPKIGELRLFYQPENATEEIIATAGSTEIFVNGAAQSAETAPIIQEDKAFLPTDFLTKMLGLDINYNKETQQIKILNNLSGEKTYYVSTTGSDENPGTLEQPFLTIGRAAELMNAGDTCIIREGTYRETVIPKNSGSKGSPITFKAYPGENVIVSGADVLEGEWSLHKDNIYQTTADKKYTQLFVDGRMMNIARSAECEGERCAEFRLLRKGR